MKFNNVPLFITTAAAIILALLKNHIAINNPDEAIGSLLFTYTVSWLIIIMLQQPLKRSWSAFVNSFRFVLTFVKAF